MLLEMLLSVECVNAEPEGKGCICWLCYNSGGTKRVGTKSFGTKCVQIASRTDAVWWERMPFCTFQFSLLDRSNP